MNEWKDRKPHVATVALVNSRWGGGGFRCSLCGKKFVEGDTYRWVYMNGNSPSPGNFFVGSECDQDGLEEKVRESLRVFPSNIDAWAMWHKYHAVGQRAAELSAAHEQIDSLKSQLTAALDTAEAFWISFKNHYYHPTGCSCKGCANMRDLLSTKPQTTP